MVERGRALSRRTGWDSEGIAREEREEDEK